MNHRFFIRSLLIVLMSSLLLFTFTACDFGSLFGADGSLKADAGIDQFALPGDTVQLDGSESELPATQTVTVLWEITKQPVGSSLTDADLIDSTTLEPSLVPDVGGQYELKLSLTGSDTSSSDTVGIEVDNPPVANAGGSIVTTVNTPVSFNASLSSDIDDDTLSYSWVFGDGATSSSMNVTHTYDSASLYTATLTVTDEHGASHSDEISVAVNAPAANIAPSVAIPQPNVSVINEGDSISFSASGSSDPEGGSLSYLWSMGDTTEYTTPDVTHTYAEPGSYKVTCTVTDPDGGESSLVKYVFVNQRPAAEIGAVFNGEDAAITETLTINRNSTVDLSGTASADPEEGPLSFAWELGDGRTASASALSEVSWDSPGEKTVSLVVKDDHGAQSDPATFTVNVVNLVPAADAGNNVYTDNTTLPVTVNFSGLLSSDPDNTALSYSWDFGDSSPLGTEAAPSHSYAAAGTYTVTLTVTDADGAFSTDSIVVVVADLGTPDSDPPVHNLPEPPQSDELAAALADYSGAAWGTVYALVNRPFVLDASRSYDAGGLQTLIDSGASLTYAWDFGDGDTASGESVIHQYTSTGTMTVTLDVTDDEGTTVTDTYAIEVIPLPNIAPVAYAGTNITVDVDQQFTLNGAESTDADGSIVSYQWDFSSADGVDFTTPDATGPNPVHSFSQPGTYLVSLKVTDNGKTNYQAKSSTDTMRVMVVKPYVNELPVAMPGPSRTIYALDAVSFFGSGSYDPDGSIESFNWEFGDGATSNAADPVHTYAAEGEYTVTLTVTDNNGETGQTSITVTVQPPIQAYQISLGYSGAGVVSPDTPFAIDLIKDGTLVHSRIVNTPGDYLLQTADIAEGWDDTADYFIRVRHGERAGDNLNNPYWAFYSSSGSGGMVFNAAAAEPVVVNQPNSMTFSNDNSATLSISAW